MLLEGWSVLPRLIGPGCLVLATTLWAPAQAVAGDRDQCVSIQGRITNRSTREFRADAENRCGESIELCVCLEQTDGRWDCGLTTVGANRRTFFWTLDSTGHYRWGAVRKNSYMNCR